MVVSTGSTFDGPPTRFAETAGRPGRGGPAVALVYAEISGQYFGDVERRHPDRVVNVGIREQLLVNVGAGLALTGMRPIVHTFAPFLVERAFEQIKLGFGHQDVGGVLVGSGGSYDIASGGRTHQAPGDVALIDTLPGWTVHVPGHADEVEAALRLAVAAGGRDYVRVSGQQNWLAFPVGRAGSTSYAAGRARPWSPSDRSSTRCSRRPATSTSPCSTPTSCGPSTPHALRAVLATPEVVLVEPYLAGTSSRLVADALSDVPHRLLALGAQ